MGIGEKSPTFIQNDLVAAGMPLLLGLRHYLEKTLLRSSVHLNTMPLLIGLKNVKTIC